MTILLLPNEILLKIFKDNSISVIDIFNLLQVCTRFKSINDSEDIWKSKFINGWPWIWKKIYRKVHLVKDWKKEIQAVRILEKNVNDKLETLSFELYKYRNITTPVLNSITEFFDIGTFGSIYVLHKIREIVLQLRQTSLTHQYYAKLILHHVHQLNCEEEWREYFALELQKQTLEKGAFLFAKWFQPMVFLELKLEDITLTLDKLALEVQAYLKSNHPTHRAVTHEIVHLDEMLPETIWSASECEILFDCVNHVLFTVNEYKGNEHYYVMDNSFINKVIDTKKGIPVTLSIIYSSVCHRLGIKLLPVNCPSHFMLKWRIPNSERMEYIDPYGKGSRKSATGMTFGNHPMMSQSNSICPTSKVLERMANNTVHVGQRNPQNLERYTDMCSAVEISVIFKPHDEDLLEFVYSLYLSFEMHVDRIISGCDDMLRLKPHLNQRFSRLREEAKHLLSVQEKGPKPVEKKTRSPNDSVKFATGMVMNHKLYHYTCVIYGWDTSCKMPMEWIMQMNVLALKYQHKQPFYNVLVADGSQRYAAQENLLVTDSITVSHKEIGKYFKEFNQRYYVPNNELNSEYPDEDAVRMQYYPNET